VSRRWKWWIVFAFVLVWAVRIATATWGGRTVEELGIYSWGAANVALLLVILWRRDRERRLAQ
jgi:hypothetical protein